jgi:hypothetical protein
MEKSFLQKVCFAFILSYLNLATKPQRILNKAQRHDPFAEPPPITENDIGQGMMNLVVRGIIPKDVDLTPAFVRGAPPFAFKQAKYLFFFKYTNVLEYMTEVKCM